MRTMSVLFLRAGSLSLGSFKSLDHSFFSIVLWPLLLLRSFNEGEIILPVQKTHGLLHGLFNLFPNVF